MEVVKSLCPKNNSLLFFEVSDRSFHQVSEILTCTKTRYSIHGWFHGETNFRPSAKLSPLPELLSYVNVDASLFFDWITEKYLKPTNQTEIQLKFMDSSEIKLEKIFHVILQTFFDLRRRSLREGCTLPCNHFLVMYLKFLRISKHNLC